MIKVHPFTVLCDLLREPNSEVMDIFKDYMVRSRTSQVHSNPQLIELKVNKIEPISDMNKAKQKIDNLLHEISNCDNDFAVFEKASKVLTLDGIGKLMGLLLKQIPEGFLDKVKKKNQYSISIPEEMIDLSQAHRLVEFRDKFLKDKFIIK